MKKFLLSLAVVMMPLFAMAQYEEDTDMAMSM